MALCGSLLFLFFFSWQIHISCLLPSSILHKLDSHRMKKLKQFKSEGTFVSLQSLIPVQSRANFEVKSHCFGQILTISKDGDSFQVLCSLCGDLAHTEESFWWSLRDHCPLLHKLTAPAEWGIFAPAPSSTALSCFVSITEILLRITESYNGLCWEGP